MANTTVIDSDSPTITERRRNSSGSRSGVEKSPRPSKRLSTPGPEKADTPIVEPTPAACEGALSLLQAAFDQALEAGLRARVYQMPLTPGTLEQMPQTASAGSQIPQVEMPQPAEPRSLITPILIMELHGVLKCPNCHVWLMELPQPKVGEMGGIIGIGGWRCPACQSAIAAIAPAS